jgi:peptidoglycan hydrolase CwlO-like protein
VSVVRSTGVAEHLSPRLVLTRLNANRFAAVALISALVVVPAAAQVAGAASTKDKVTSTQQAVDDAADRWFRAQNVAADIDARIRDLEQRSRDAQGRVDALRVQARDRAVMLYKTRDVGLATMLDTSGTNALDAARREQLVGTANAENEAVIGDLTAALDDLKTQTRELERERDAQREVLDRVGNEREALEAQLDGLRAQAARETEATLKAARTQQARQQANTRLRSLRTRSVGNRAASATAPVRESAPAPTTTVAAPNNGGRVSAHHNDPFLVCTRMRESGGNYAINTGNGYYGAYQFLPSTWDTVASHAGRRDLVGVLPSNASAFDQDELAWSLYQWQGKGPWGGRC